MLKAKTTVLNYFECMFYLYPACMDEKYSFNTDLNNLFKFSKLLDQFSLSAVKHSWV